MSEKASLIKKLERLADEKDIISHRWNRLLTVSNLLLGINIVIDLGEDDVEDQLRDAINVIEGIA